MFNNCLNYCKFRKVAEIYSRRENYEKILGMEILKCAFMSIHSTFGNYLELDENSCRRYYNINSICTTQFRIHWPQYLLPLRPKCNFVSAWPAFQFLSSTYMTFLQLNLPRVWMLLISFTFIINHIFINCLIQCL